MQKITKHLNKNFSSKIQSIIGRQLIDSRGFPTVEAEVTTEKGIFRAIVPSGASTGKFEALELRDNGPTYHGKSVMQAVKNINEIISPALKNKDVVDQFALDKLMVQELDGQKNEFGWNKSKLGANTILAVSMAIARAGAKDQETPLYQYLANLSGNGNQEKYLMPVPSFNVLNGGEHAGNTLAFQEFMIMPVGAESFREAMQMGSEIYHVLKGIIKKKFGPEGTLIGDEGGFAPQIKDEREALDLLVLAIEKSGYAGKIKIALDVAASEFYNEETEIYDLGYKW